MNARSVIDGRPADSGDDGSLRPIQASYESSGYSESHVEISVVIPAFNEAKDIGRTIDSLRHYFASRRMSFEVCVVDDGSQDNTLELARRLNVSKLLVNSTNMGKAAAVRKGVLRTSGQYVLVMDCDSSTPIDELDKLLRHTEEADLVIASRYLPQSEILAKQPPWRQLNSLLFRSIARGLMALGVSDSQCGFKLFRSTTIESVFGEPFLGRFSFDVEILRRAIDSHWRISEVPVVWRDRPDSRLRPRDVLMMYVDLIRAWLHFSFNHRQTQGESHPLRGPAQTCRADDSKAQYRKNRSYS